MGLVHNKQDIATLRHSLVNMSELTPGGLSSVTWPVGIPSGIVPTNRFDVIRWDYFTDTEIYLDSDFSNGKKLEGADKNDIQVTNNWDPSTKIPFCIYAEKRVVKCLIISCMLSIAGNIYPILPCCAVYQCARNRTVLTLILLKWRKWWANNASN